MNLENVINAKASEGWNSFVVKKENYSTKYFLNGKQVFESTPSK